jgi:hypothetical protein
MQGGRRQARENRGLHQQTEIIPLSPQNSENETCEAGVKERERLSEIYFHKAVLFL